MGVNVLEQVDLEPIDPSSYRGFEKSFRRFRDGRVAPDWRKLAGFGDSFQVEAKSCDREDGSQVDVLFVCALLEELQGLGRAIGIEWERWPEDMSQYSAHRFAFRSCKYNGLNLVACSKNCQGAVDAAALTTRAIYAMHPRVVVMTGICCGHKGKTGLGHIAIASESFDFQDYRANPDGSRGYRPHPIVLNGVVKDALHACSETNRHREGILSDWSGLGEEVPAGGAFELKVHIGTMACSSLLVDDETVVKELEQRNDDFVGIDKESYGVAMAADSLNVPWIVVKGIQDYGDGDKGSVEKIYRKLASYASAKYALSVLPTVFNYFDNC